MKDYELKIEYLPVDSLTPYEKNTRKHSPTDIEGIKKSILDVGFDDPIGIWGKNNIIVEGHGRAIAAKELNLEKVPCIRLDHLTDAQRRDSAAGPRLGEEVNQCQRIRSARPSVMQKVAS